MVNVLNQIIMYLRNMLIDYYSMTSDLKYNENDIVNFNIFFSEKLFDIKRSENPKIIIEMLLIKFINENNGNDVKVNKSEIITQKVEDKDENVDNNIEIKDTNENKIDDSNVDKAVNKNSKVITNIEDIMNVRFINTLISSKKVLKNSELKLLDKLREESFNTEYGSIINDILDGNIVCVSDDNVVFSFDRDSVRKNNLLNYLYIKDLYKKITGSNKNICFISNDLWDSESKKFMKSFKNKSVESDYKYEDEPKPLYEKEKDDIIMSSAIDLFDSDIIEVE